tara:strand:- start:730 stop:960 length:231 start_codon:yes stop_codon:yes gene_type:complete
MSEWHRAFPAPEYADPYVWNVLFPSLHGSFEAGVPLFVTKDQEEAVRKHILSVNRAGGRHDFDGDVTFRGEPLVVL